MNRRMPLMTALTLLIGLSVLNLNIRYGSAPPQSPYIAVVPQSNIVYVGFNYTISIETDYAGSDVWGWDVRLKFNQSVLQCVKVTNGDLITIAKDPSAEFHSTINNTAGIVQAGADFYYDIPPPPVTTSGPGILVKFTFKGLSTGYSALTFERETKLQVYDPQINLIEPVIRIAADLHPNQIGHGTAVITIPGDCDGSKMVDGVDFGIFAPCYGSLAGQPTFKAVADIDGDGDVDGVDFGSFAPNYGQGW